MAPIDHNSSQLLEFNAHLEMTGSIDSQRRGGIRFELFFKENSLDLWRMVIKFHSEYDKMPS